MATFKIVDADHKIVRADSDGMLVTDVQSILDLMATIRYEFDSGKIVLDKSAIHPDFFVLSTRLAGEILQKCVNYQVRLAIVGDYSGYTSKPLKDFIYESNRGRHCCFVSTEEEALECLRR